MKKPKTLYYNKETKEWEPENKTKYLNDKQQKEGESRRK